MSDALTESFCERCGTRYEFTAPVELSPLRKTRGLLSGLKNYILSQDALSDAVGDAMRTQEQALADKQLEAFHETFNFCIDCRQYTCLSCWNHEAGRCQSCVPIPGAPTLEERMAVAAAAEQARLAALATAPEAWPETDLEVAAEVEPEPIAEPEPVYQPEPVYVAEVEPEPIVEPEPVYEPPVIPYRPIVPLADTFGRTTVPEPEPQPLAAVADDADTAARRAQLDLLGLGDPGQGPVAPTRTVLPYRSSGASAPAGARPAAMSGGMFWDASAREVAGAVSGIGVRSCPKCDLSLSATARFCRRCGTPQAQSA